jgi:signal transduction histidine kinase
MAARLAGWLGPARVWFRPPRRTVRFRLTALYSALFLAAAVALIAVTYLLVDHSTTSALFVNRGGKSIVVKARAAGRWPRAFPTPRPGSLTARQFRTARQLAAQAMAQHARDLHQLLVQSGVALAIVMVLAVACGWLLAGRVLRPLRAMTTATKRISERNLHERLTLPGPPDEVKDLADTIDGLLARLEAAFQAQRNFVASASHELRTPLTFDRALLEVALADPDATIADFRATCQDLLASGEQQERLIEALLALASSERGLDQWDRFDLAAVTEQAMAAYRTDAMRVGVQVNAALRAAPVAGNPDLAGRMAANLIDNAIRHNLPGGWVEVRTETVGQDSVLTVSNTGPPVPRDQAERLFQPFQRLDSDRAGHPDGHGLGLAIVRAIAIAHNARLRVGLRRDGGLDIEVLFPSPGFPSPGASGEPAPAHRATLVRREG